MIYNIFFSIFIYIDAYGIWHTAVHWNYPVTWRHGWETSRCTRSFCEILDFWRRSMQPLTELTEICESVMRTGDSKKAATRIITCLQYQVPYIVLYIVYNRIFPNFNKSPAMLFVIFGPFVGEEMRLYQPRLGVQTTGLTSNAVNWVVEASQATHSAGTSLCGAREANEVLLKTCDMWRLQFAIDERLLNCYWLLHCHY